jgi:hypothetical protein
MPIEDTLRKVENDIQAGDLGKARDRLHGLISNYPDNIELRDELGQIYWRLQMPEMAGRYWYLVENKDENMAGAGQRFEAKFGNDPALILFAIKFRGDLEAIKDTFAGQVLLDLDLRAKEKHTWYEDFRKKGAAKYQQDKRDSVKNKTSGFVIKWGCITAIVLLILFFLIGVIVSIVAFIRWIA